MPLLPIALLVLLIGGLVVANRKSGAPLATAVQTLTTGQNYWLSVDLTNLPGQTPATIAALMAASNNWVPVLIYGVPGSGAMAVQPINPPAGWMTAWATQKSAVAIAKWVGTNGAPMASAGAGVTVYGAAPAT
jgi:hypothetical protein